LKREKPDRSAAQIVRILRAQSGWAPSERTLQRHFDRLELDRDIQAGPPQVFGRFEADRCNEIWVGDALWRHRHKLSYADCLVMPVRPWTCWCAGKSGVSVRHNQRLSRNVMIVSVGW
jgi:hypothetical protein